jgi:hypothetical protein
MRAQRAPDPHAPLRREANHLYTEHVKPALKASLLGVKPGAAFDQEDYVIDVADNLLPGLRVAAIEKEFDAGAGGELKGKMRAPWSSSALAINAFLPWRTNETPVGFLGLGPFSPAFEFEARCPNKVSGAPPHLDVLLRRNHEVLGVESKCTEFIQGSAHTAVSSRYLALERRGDERTASKWFGALSHADDFPLLDTYQLVKHYLGLRNRYPDHVLTIAYLYWEPTNAAAHRPFREHRAEISRFSNFVADDATCCFVAANYADVWREWAAPPDAPEWLTRHLELLRRRYLLVI